MITKNTQHFNNVVSNLSRYINCFFCIAEGKKRDEEQIKSLVCLTRGKECVLHTIMKHERGNKIQG